MYRISPTIFVRRNLPPFDSCGRALLYLNIAGTIRTHKSRSRFSRQVPGYLPLIHVDVPASVPEYRWHNPYQYSHCRMSARLAPSSRPLPLAFVAFLSFFVFPWPSPLRVINVIIITFSLLCRGAGGDKLSANKPGATKLPRFLSVAEWRCQPRRHQACGSDAGSDTRLSDTTVCAARKR